MDTKISFNDLQVGSHFLLPNGTNHESKILEKIQPVQYVTQQGVELHDVYYNARWVGGPHDKMQCIIAKGTKQAPFMVIKVD